MLGVGFEPTRLAPAELKSASLDLSDNPTFTSHGFEPVTTRLRLVHATNLANVAVVCRTAVSLANLASFSYRL